MISTIQEAPIIDVVILNKKKTNLRTLLSKKIMCIVIIAKIWYALIRNYGIYKHFRLSRIVNERNKIIIVGN